MAQQVLEDVELFCGEVKKARSSGDFPRDEVHLEILVPQLEDLVHAPAAQQRADACEQLGERERLDQVVVGAAVESQHPIFDGVPSRQDEYRRLNAALAQRRQNVDAIASRQHEIEQQQIE